MSDARYDLSGDFDVISILDAQPHFPDESIGIDSPTIRGLKHHVDVSLRVQGLQRNTEGSALYHGDTHITHG